MKRKLLTFGIVFIMILTAIFAFSSCNKTQCKHNWEDVVIKAATCEEAGETQHTCTLCGETNVETVAAKGHSYAPQWTWNGTSSAHATLVCKNDNTHKVENLNGTVEVTTTAPTCLEVGKNTYIASANYRGVTYTDTLVNSIEATLEHNYLDGACTKCLSLDPSCTHENTVFETIDTKELGACAGYLVVEKCEACGVCVNVEAQTRCYFETVSTSSTVDGITKRTSRCTYCGLEQNQAIYNYRSEYGCSSYARMVCSIMLRNRTIVEDIMMTSYSNGHYLTTTTVLASELGIPACGDILVSKCYYCGEIFDYIDLDDCVMSYEDYDSESCIYCNCGITTETVTEEKGCQTIEKTIKVVRCGNETYFEKETITSTSADHTFDEPKYEFVDKEDCENGCFILETCTSCEYSNVEFIASHHFINSDEGKYIFDGCLGEGYIDVQTCICGKEKDIDFSYSCLSYFGYEETVDDDGTEHSVTKRHCSTCNLWLVIDEYEMVEDCKANEYLSVFIYLEIDGELDDELNFSMSSTLYNTTILIGTRDSHEYADIPTNVELYGKDCTDGFKVSYACENCDEIYEITDDYHQFISYIYYAEDYIEEENCCGGYVEVEKCPCGLYRDFAINLNCDFNIDERKEFDNDGNAHNIREGVCSTCGTKVVIDDATYIKDCYAREITRVSVTFDDTTVVDKFSMLEDEYDSHKYVYSFHLNGNDCEDGYTVSGVCQDCGDKTTASGSDHIAYATQIVDLSGYNVCKTHYMRFLECACGKNTKCEFDIQDVEKQESGNQEIWQCQDCGYKVTKVTSESDNGCEHVVVSDITLKYNSNIVADFEESYTYYLHNMIPYLNKETRTADNGSSYEYVYYGKECSDCGEIELDIRTESVDTLIGSTYYYCFDFTPSKSAYYTIDGLSSQDTYVYLYKGDTQLASDDDDGINRQFQLCYYLEAGVKYTYRIRNYDTSDIYTPISFRHYEGESNCQHEYGSTRDLIASVPCQYNYYAQICSSCEEIVSASISVEEITGHATESNIVVDENGKFAISGASCPCGEVIEEETKTSSVGPSDVKYAYINTGDTYYEYEFTPIQSGYYTILGLASYDTKVELYYDDSRLGSNDDGANYSAQFLLESYLEEGNTYTYRIRFYDSDDTGEIPFVIFVRDAYCSHGSLETFEYEGVEYVLCQNCLIPRRVDK